jgi:hypothetical protein
MPAGRKNPYEGAFLEGRYANYFEIGHNAFEFLLDFGQMYLEGPEARMHTRIVTSPIFAKKLAETLNRALCQYEQAHGSVPDEVGEAESEARSDNLRHLRALKTPKDSGF